MIAYDTRTGCEEIINIDESFEKSCFRCWGVAKKAWRATEYQALKLDLVLFQPDGVIGRRFAVDLGPLKPQKRTVKLFDINTPCEQVGSLLINDVMDCKGESGAIPNCLANITATSLTKQQLSK